MEIEWWPPYRETRILFHAKWSKFKIHNKIPPNLSAMLGEDEKINRDKFCKKILYSDRANIEKGYSQDLVKQNVDLSENYADFNP